jgi:hypothetical protein
MTATYTSAPEVKAYLQDTLLPAAVSALASTITVKGATVPLRRPDICYGKWAGANPPPAYIMIGPTTSGSDTPAAVFPANSGVAWRDDTYSIQLLVWYSIGDSSALAQRVATESAYAMFRAIAAQIESNVSGFSAIVGGGGRALLSSVQDFEYDASEGRGCGLSLQLEVKARI